MVFTGLKQALPAGSHFPLTLRFERAGEVRIEMKVRSPGESAPGGSGHAH